MQSDCPGDDPKKFAAWCWAAGIPDPSPARPYPIPLIGPMLVEGVSEMLWNFGFRHHPELQTKWIEGTAGLATMANIVSQKPESDEFSVLAEEFLADKDPGLLAKIKSGSDEERKELKSQLQKSISDLTALLSLVEEGGES